jgi:hypothetical protein
MLWSPSAIGKAGIANDWILLAVEVSADMRGLLFSMNEAGNSPGCKGVIINHCSIWFRFNLLAKLLLFRISIATLLPSTHIKAIEWRVPLRQLAIYYLFIIKLIHSNDNYSSMKGSCLSMNKIYGESKIDSLKRRIDFISSKRKKNWPVIETKLL